MAVLLYHADFSWACGGFLGVDVFFVLSGYLITTLLLNEHAANARINLGRFYLRRARRLLPALFTVIAGTCLYVIAALPREAATFRGDAAAALTYATNWWLIIRQQSYFGGTGRPSLLINLWSLAVEEQFYLLWPLILGLLLTARTKRARAQAEAHAHGTAAQPSLRPALLATIALAAASALTMKALYSPWKDPSRVYYGSDTRAFELLTGACLAMAIATATRPRNSNQPQPAAPALPIPIPAPFASSPPSAFSSLATAAPASAPAPDSAPPRRWQIIIRDGLGALALVALGYAFVAIPASTPQLYPLGLLAVCVASVLAIHAATAHGLIARLLAARPLVWLGERSYSLYLWHWPIFDVTRPGVDVHLPIPIDFTLRIGISLLFAHLTFRYVENPIRHGAIGRVLARSHGALRQRRLALPVGVAALTLTLAACGVGLGNQLIDTAQRYPANPDAIAEDSGPALTLSGPAPRAAHGSVAARPTHQPAAAPASAIPTAMPVPPAHPPTVAFVGDSQGMTLLLNKPADLGQYLVAIDDTTEGCGFLGGDISSRDGERRNLDADCGGADTKWAARIARQRPDMVVVMIGGWDEFDETINGSTMTFGSTAWDSYYNSRLADAIGKLEATGVPRIELSLLPCYRPVPEPGSGYWPERGDDTRTRHINTLLTAYAQSHGDDSTGPGAVRTLQPPPAFCADPHIAKDLDYRWDGTHYYKPGSALYFRTAIPQLLAPLY